MSIGPHEKDDTSFEVPLTKQAEYLVRKSIAFLWEDPLKNIFLISLIICMGGLIFGHTFPFEFYVILGILSVVEVYLFFMEKSEQIIITGSPEKHV